jgi:hypothetical protein
VRTATLRPRLTLGEARQGCRLDTLAGLLPGAAGVVVSSTRHPRSVEAMVLPPSSTVIDPTKAFYLAPPGYVETIRATASPTVARHASGQVRGGPMVALSSW